MTGDYYFDPEVAASYDEASPGLEGDVDFYLQLARESWAAGEPVLELACGTGRVAIPVAREGIRIVGLDQSPAMLAIARQRAEDADNPRWVEADMSDFDLDQRFGLVFIPYRSFLLLDSVEKQLSCLRSAARHLIDEGKLALNVFNPDLICLAEWLKTQQPAVSTIGEGRLPDGRRMKAISQAAYRLNRQELEDTRLVEEIDAQGTVVGRAERKMKLRYVFRYEMEHLLALGGLEVEALYGGFNGEPFAETSTEMVWVARKPAA